MAARIRKVWHDETIRQKIRVGLLSKRLQDHADGKVDMSATQVRAAEILLRKVLPDLASVEHSGNVEQTYVVSMPANVTAAEWNGKELEAKPVQALTLAPTEH
jgi:hypothetical protein